MYRQQLQSDLKIFQSEVYSYSELSLIQEYNTITNGKGE